MDIRKLQRAIVDGLEDVKAQNIQVFNTEHLSPLFERVIIASGTSNRQTKALASSVRETVKGRGMQVMRTEGEDNGEWIIVDCGAAVVHVMQPAIREYYHLEEIWGGKPVKLKLGDGEVKLVKASEPMGDEPKAAKKAKAPAAKKAAAPAKKAAAKSAAPAAKKAPAKKGTVSKTTGVKKAAPAKTAAPVKTLKVGAAKPAAKKTVAKKAAPAAKPVARKSVAAKPTAKPAAKKAAPARAKKA
ncbi:MAG: ribosome silencing factor [Roseateles asaccharophilus]|uniref:Ribosomal silencing factor RsfS n=1 Tax=Roseateles asaccharophilus TaxID=582607 RepID=A0A4R6N9K6_9BURK|nr:ribosome silencing factor [Roseateles asaccharophilus]MDN3543803.1 ribosome silencing factor [Roseateles asaccharophilus]TDP11819.1 ribosome-associated protein [Roseateles asaccharophilus]